MVPAVQALHPGVAVVQVQGVPDRALVVVEAAVQVVAEVAVAGNDFNHIGT